MSFHRRLLALSIALAPLYVCQAIARPQNAAPSTAAAVPTPVAHPDDVRTIDGLLKALYDSVSGPEGATRDWDRYLALFQPDGRQVVIVHNAESKTALPSFTAAQYVQRVRGQKPPALYERELRRRVDQFGQMAGVTSVYEVRAELNGPVKSRAVYNLQLAYDGTRWWIANVIWQSEGPGLTVPADYPAGATPF